MKCTVMIDPDLPEEVTVCVKKRTDLVDKIEQICRENGLTLIGYTDSGAQRLNLSDVYFFAIEDTKVKAHTEMGEFHLKCRLFTLEETLPESFIKINQSCIANISMIERFDTSLTGTLLVRFKNGKKDYVSRRNIRRVKERFGL